MSATRRNDSIARQGVLYMALELSGREKGREKVSELFFLNHQLLWARKIVLTPFASLAELLDRPGFRGHATVRPVVPRALARGQSSNMAADRLVTTDSDFAANSTNLNRAMKELTVAALLYRCGDRDSRTKTVLLQYAQDIHGHFARYARAVLDGPPLLG